MPKHSRIVLCYVVKCK